MDQNILYGYLSILIMILISLIVFFFVLCRENIFNKLRYFLISMGVGALAGDSLLHILPDVLQQYKLNENGIIEKNETNIILASILVVAGYLVSFIIEKFLYPHAHGPGHSDDEFGPRESINEKTSLYKGETYTFLELLKQGFIVNLLMGDVIHNFVDGLVIMAGFSNGFEEGLATSLAIALHEVPHEISNFAAFRKIASFKQAVFLNFFGALSSLLGGTIILIAFEVQNISDYILSFGAGNFLYVSSAILIPELDFHNYPVYRTVQQFFQICGVLLGILLMYSILIYEHLTGGE